MKRSLVVLLAFSCLAPAAASSQSVQVSGEIPQSPIFDIHARDSTAGIRAFTEASRVGVSLNSLDREAVETVERHVDPTTERVVGYAALAAGVIVITILVIGFYKLFKMFGA